MRHVATFQEIRVQVSISYTLNWPKYDDGNLLEKVGDVDTFEPLEQQLYGCGQIDEGFIIFIGKTVPTEFQIEQMKSNVLTALKTCKV